MRGLGEGGGGIITTGLSFSDLVSLTLEPEVLGTLKSLWGAEVVAFEPGYCQPFCHRFQLMADKRGSV